MAVGTPLAATLLEKSVSPSNVTKHLKAGDKKRETKTGGGMGAMGEQMVALLAYPIVFFLSLV